MQPGRLSLPRQRPRGTGLQWLPARHGRALDAHWSVLLTGCPSAKRGWGHDCCVFFLLSCLRSQTADCALVVVAVVNLCGDKYSRLARTVRRPHSEIEKCS